MSSEDPEERLRTRPSERFAGSVNQFDLEEELKRIRSEDLSEGGNSEEHLQQGHRQIELHRHGDTTVTLYHFDSDGSIPEHSLEDGLVVLQVLNGSLEVDLEDETVELEEQGMLTIEDGINHALCAAGECQFLLTISR